jgi:hypothetical protein
MLIAVETSVNDLVEQLKVLRCQSAVTIEGYACGEVARKVLRVSLSDYPDQETRARLLSIKTGLTLPHQDVDALVAAGRTVIARDAAEIAAFLGPPPQTQLAAAP